MRSFCVEMKILVRSALLFCILFLGCSKIDPKIEVPSYIEVDNYTVSVDTNTQGTSMQDFTDVLIYTTTQDLGYYPIGSKIPITKNGDTYLSIRPVILVNGVKYLRVDYPMMKGYDTTFALKQGQILNVNPVFKYFSTVTFPVVENFEKVNVTMVNSDATDTVTASIDHTNAQYGSKCLSIHLDSTHALSQVQSTTGFTLSSTGAASYLEINYKGNFDLEAGIIGSDNPGYIHNPSQRSAGGMKASGTWKKLYINLTDLARTPPLSPYWFLYLYTSRSFDLTNSNPQIYVDNIKVVRQ